MKNIALSFLVISSILMVGCDQGNDYKLPEKNSQSTTVIPAPPSAQITQEQAELKEYLAQMQAKDPSIVDAYYGVDENGEKVLHVIQKDESSTASDGSGSALSSFMWSMAGGLTGAMLMNAFMNRGGMSGMTNNYPPNKSAVMNRSQYLNSKAQSRTAYGSFASRTGQKNIYGKPMNTITPTNGNSVNRSATTQTSPSNTRTIVQKAKPKQSFKKFSGFGTRSKRR